MTGAKKGIVPGVFIFAGIFWLALLIAVSVAAESAILAYPSTGAVFRYDPVRYSLLVPGHEKFDPGFAIGNQMLWDNFDGRVPREFNRAPALYGYEASAGIGSEYYTTNNEFDITVDGYGEMPRTLANLHIRFLPLDGSSELAVDLDGQPIMGLTCRIADFSVSTPTGDGHYADTMVHHVIWSGPQSIRIVVFSDKNLNGVFDDGPPLLSVVAKGDTPIPVESTSWGAVKSLYSPSQ